MIQMVQTCVDSENGFGSRLRLQLRPHLVNLNEVFRKYGFDTNKNLVCIASYFHINQLSANGTFKEYENFVTALYC